MRRHCDDERGVKDRSLRHFLKELLYRCWECARDVFTRMVQVSYMLNLDPRLAYAYLWKCYPATDPVLAIPAA